MRKRRTVSARGRGRATKEEAPARRSKSRVVVHKPNLKRIRAQMKKIKARRGSYWKPSLGKNLIRILPPWSDAGFWYKDSLRHFMRPTDGGKMKTISCPTLDGERCAICEHRAKLRESKSKVKQKLADQLAPTLDFHVNMVDMKDQDSGVQIGRLTETVVTQLLEYMMDPEWGDFTDPRKGFTVILTRVGDGMNTKYSVMLSRKQSRLKDVSWLKELKDLDELFPRSEYAETKAFLIGDDAEEDDDEELEDEDYEEEEDEEDDDEEEDDEEEDDE